MKNLIRYYFLLIIIMMVSCTEKEKEEQKVMEKALILQALPFETISLNSMTSFKPTSNNWQLAGNVYADRSTDKAITAEKGTGILVNIPREGEKGALFTNFEHGDIAFECDVLMPKNSNSGLYFQGRYEVQLFDSWGVKSISHSDMGGIYQRWDTSRGEGNEGFEGVPPTTNAAKSPGLWQHLKVIFHAPKFDASGTKTKNAWFEEVWLNGVLIHENVEVSGPTRAAAYAGEKPKDALMIQGDHGPVAFKNINYKLYDNQKITLSDITMNEYDSKEVVITNFDSLVAIRTVKTDTISAAMVSGERPKKILKYEGMMTLPKTGDYLFDFKVNGAGGYLLIAKDTVVNLNGDYNLDSLGLGKISLKKGTVPFTLVYNKHRPWTQGFSLEVEGEGIQKYPLTAPSSLDLTRNMPDEKYMIAVENQPVLQRSFLMHNDAKRTHCISVGNPEKIHFAYDLASASLLKAWSGKFLDATMMWHQRGEKQLGVPAGFTVSFHGDPEFVLLPNAEAAWPNGKEENTAYKLLGYELDQDRIPIFSFSIGENVFTDAIKPSKTMRSLTRTITSMSNQDFWHKVAEGEAIELLPDGTYIVNNQSYFIDFSTSNEEKPILRKSKNGTDELLVKMTSGNRQIKYNIIW